MEWLAQQIDIMNAADKGGNLIVDADAGTGKSTLQLEIARRKNNKALMLSFNQDMKVENTKKAKALKLISPTGLDVRTLHGWGISMFPHKFKVEPWKVDAYIREQHKGEPDFARKLTFALKQFRGRGVIDTSEQGIKNELKVQQFIRMSDENKAYWLANRDRLRKALVDLDSIKDVIDFDDMCRMPVIYGWANGAANGLEQLYLDEIQDLNNDQHELVRMAVTGQSTQLIGVGDQKQCQPPGTKVMCPDGRVKKIEDVVPGDFYCTWSVSSSRIVGRAVYQKTKIGGQTAAPNAKLLSVQKVASHDYEGYLIKVQAGGESSRYTPNHKCMARIPSGKSLHHVYLMQKGRKARVGITTIPSQRMRLERADNMWILRSFETRNAARVYESFISIKYGLPEWCFTADKEATFKIHQLDKKAFADWNINKRGLLESFWSMMGDLTPKLHLALMDHKREYAFPYIGKRDRLSWVIEGSKRCFQIRACNLIEGFHQVCVVSRGSTKIEDSNTWSDIVVTQRWYSGPVYSLECESGWDHDKTYIADNILTHNSVYGFRGAIDSLNKMKAIIGGETLPLNTTFRCHEAIVEFVNEQVDASGMVALHPGGEVEKRQLKRKENQLGIPYIIAAEVDMIISSRNSTLISVWVALMLEGIDADLKGTDVAKGVKSVVASIQTYNWSEFMRTLQLTAADDKRNRFFDQHADMARGVLEIIRGMNVRSKHELFSVIDKMKLVNKGIKLETVHSSKGREAERVAVICDWFNSQDDPMDNLRYVAWTRAISYLLVIKPKAA